MEQQPLYKPNGVTPPHDGAARRWLLRRLECVPSLRLQNRRGFWLHGSCCSVPGVESPSPQPPCPVGSTQNNPAKGNALSMAPKPTATRGGFRGPSTLGL